VNSWVFFSSEEKQGAGLGRGLIYRLETLLRSRLRGTFSFESG
jgi:hypothetical protein